MTYSIIHQPEQQQFVYGPAHINYQINVERQQVDFYHTYVPDSLRGQGIAALLTKAALVWAHQKQLTIHASCSYVAQYLAKHAAKS